MARRARRGADSKVIAAIIVIILIIAGAAIYLGKKGGQQTTTGGGGQYVTIKIGALLPLTGDLQSYGQRASAAIEYAVQEMNDYLAQHNASFRLELVVENTETKPDIAVQKMNTLVAQGVKFVVGPMTSAEVKKVKQIADQNKVLVISPSSTAIELAIPGDYIYRFCPADDVQSKVIGKLAEDLGIKAVVIVNRADTWGQGLMNATKNVLESKGVEVYKVHPYDPEAKPFSQIASDLNNEVQELVNEYGRDKVAVVAISFGEIADLFQIAQNYPILSQVLWIGSDGTAKLDEITTNPDAADFAVKTLFINPIFSPAPTSVADKVAQYVKQKTGSEPDAYALAAHDAVVAIALAIMQAPQDYLNNPDKLVDFVKQKIPEIVSSDEFAKLSATGKFTLNEAGDRATADYDLWIVQEQNGQYQWVKVGTYYGNEQKIEWITLPNGKTFPELFAERFGSA